MVISLILPYSSNNWFDAPSPFKIDDSSLISAATSENSVKFPQKTKNRIAKWSCNLTPGCVSK